MMNDNAPERADNLLEPERDPYSQLRGDWVRISTGGRSEIGIYRGLNKHRLHILKPYLENESFPDQPERTRVTQFYVLDRPAFVSDTPDIIIAPVRKEYIETLVDGNK